MRSKPTGQKKRLTQEVLAQKTKASQQSGRQNYKRGRALSRMLDQMWGK